MKVSNRAQCVQHDFVYNLATSAKLDKVASFLFKLWNVAYNWNSCAVSYYCLYWFYSHSFVHKRTLAACRIRSWCDNSNCFSICIHVCTICTTMACLRCNCKPYHRVSESEMFPAAVVPIRASLFCNYYPFYVLVWLVMMNVAPI